MTQNILPNDSACTTVTEDKGTGTYLLCRKPPTKQTYIDFKDLCSCLVKLHSESMKAETI